MAGHISPKSTYYMIFGTLMVLTAITVAVAFVPLGVFNFPVAIAIAITKATLVILYFMHVKYEGKWVYAIMVPAGLLAVILVLALMPDIGTPYEDPGAVEETAWSAPGSSDSGTWRIVR